MIILREEYPILIAKINNTESAFYEEVKEVPKKIKESLIKYKGGCGSQVEDYFLSNTFGITSGKFFKKIREGLKLEPANHDNYLKINNTTSIENIKEFATDDLYVNYYIYPRHKTMRISVSLRINPNELIFKPFSEDDKEFGIYKDLFKNRYHYSIHSSIKVCNFDINEYKGNYNLDKGVRMSFNELEEHLKEFKVVDIENCYSSTENPYCSLPEDISIFPINEILTLQEVAHLLKKTEGTLRYHIKKGKLIEGVDYRKAGSTSLINRNSIHKLID